MFVNRLRTNLLSKPKTYFASCNKFVASSAPQIIKSDIPAGVVSIQNYTTDVEKHAEHKHAVSEKKPVKTFTSKSVTASRISTPLLRGQRRNYATYELPEKVAKLVENQPKAGVIDDEYVQHYLENKDEAETRQAAYYVLSAGRFIYTTGIRLAVLKLLYSWGASADVLAVAKIEVDISNIPRGKTVTITWRGKPIFIRHRTEEEIQIIDSTPMSDLKDPQPDSERTLNKNWSVLLAICTHLGCVPVVDSGDFKAFFCPCHGSHYDFSGRIRLGPAPLNLEVPPHQFVDNDKTIVLG